MAKATKVQVTARRNGLEKLLDGAGGEEALTALLIERLEGDMLFDVLKGQLDKGLDTYDLFDSLKTWAELVSDWRLVKKDEVIDEEKHIDGNDKDAVYDAADSLGLKVFRDETDMKEQLEGNYYAIDDPRLAEIVLGEESFNDSTGKLIAQNCAENTYDFDGLASWLELYGMELRRRGQKVG